MAELVSVQMGASQVLVKSETTHSWPEFVRAKLKRLESLPQYFDHRMLTWHEFDSNGKKKGFIDPFLAMIAVVLLWLRRKLLAARCTLLCKCR